MNSCLEVALLTTETAVAATETLDFGGIPVPTLFWERGSCSFEAFRFFFLTEGHRSAWLPKPPRKSHVTSETSDGRRKGSFWTAGWSTSKKKRTSAGAHFEIIEPWKVDEFDFLGRSGRTDTDKDILDHIITEYVIWNIQCTYFNDFVSMSCTCYWLF